MRRTTIALMAAALMAVPFAGIASADDYGTKGKSATNPQAAPAGDLLRSDNLVGSEVRDASGEELGSVHSLMINPNGKVESAILSLGGVFGLGDRKVKVPWDSLQVKRQAGDPDEIMVTASRQSLENAPAYEEPGAMGDTATRDAGDVDERDERSARMPGEGDIGAGAGTRAGGAE